MTNPRPCSADEAVQRALSVANRGGQYVYGTGGYHPQSVPDLPWTSREKDGKVGSDCAGYALSWCYKLPRHRPGFNRGGKFDVEDDVNCNSAIGDAVGAHDCFELATGMPRPGDLLTYPTFRLPNVERPFIGHVGIVVSAAKVTTWDSTIPRFDLLDVAQCCGPDFRAPAVLLTDGSHWLHRAHDWPKPEHTVYLLRVVG